MAGSGIVVIIAFLALTSIGHVIAAATQHFMLFYAGVFALIALCASVGLGLVATDRMFLSPARRVFIQSAHRAASFGAVTFLIVHIVTEILAQRVHVIDAVIPFLSPFRTFYIGLGTIASDLVILLVVTGILRGRFNASGKAWRWRALHYTSYAAFVFGVWHGLLGGRPAKPYVDWSYGFLVALVLLGLAVRILSSSLKPKESLSGPPVPETAPSASAPLRAAAMAAQLSLTPDARGDNIRGARSGGQPVLSAPVITAAALPAQAARPLGQPYYEPGYEGPQRYLGAPRAAATGPQPRAATGPMPRSTGPFPSIPGGAWPDDNTDTRPLPPFHSGPLPRVPAGPGPGAGNGPQPPYPGGLYPGHPSGPLPRTATGSRRQTGTGPWPRAATGPVPWVPARPGPAETAGPWPPYPGGLYPGHPSGPMPRAETGPQPRMAAGPQPRLAAGPVPRGGAMPPGQPRGARPGPSVWADHGPDVRYAAEPAWDGGFPEIDPDLRYREPGPGMPGYRGSRDQRYGGDRR